MSESIQSISLGTYTIGSTNELTFSAGPGIKIDSPSAGTVRIGNDETVLWENATGSRLPITVSELLSNFEFIRIEWNPYQEGSSWPMFIDVTTTKVKDGKIHISGWGLSNDQMAQVETNIIIDCSTVNLTVLKIGTITSLGNGTATSNLVGYTIFKIIGINRKTNA